MTPRAVLAHTGISADVSIAIDISGERVERNPLKVALIEVLEERSDLVREMLAEVMEEVSLVRAIQEGEGSGPASRDEVIRALEGRA